VANIVNNAGRRFLGIDFPYLLSGWKEMVNPASMPADIWAGLTVVLVALPLNLALAIASGVEPGIGITTAIVSSIIVSFLGGQKYTITGPTAAMAVVLIEIAQTYGMAAIWLVGIMAGSMQLLAGICRFGKLIAFIPSPVVVGFTNAIGLLVIFNSLENLLGLPSKPIAHAGGPPPWLIHPFVPEFIQDIVHIVWRTVVHQELNLYALICGCLVIAIAVAIPKLTKAIPGELVAIVVVSAAASFLHLQVPRIIDIAILPRSMPIPSIPVLPWDDCGALFASAIAIFMLGSIESLLSASVADGMTMSKKHHSDQELIGQGLANIVVPFFGGIPVTGVIARTAVNIRAGARTRLSGIVHAIVMMIVSFSFAGQAEQIPLAALGGILVLTGVRLTEWDVSKQIWRASKMEGLVVLLTTIVSVLVDLTAGVITGLIFTCGLFVRQMSAIKVIAQDYDPDKRAVTRQPVPTCKFVRTFLVDGPLFFGAAERFTETILVSENLKTIILHMKDVSVLDVTGVETLLSINTQLKRNGVRLILAELADQPCELLKRFNAWAEIGPENIFKDFKEAILTADQQLLETNCHGCASAIKPSEGKSMQGPKDCKLRTAVLLNTNNIAHILRDRINNVPEHNQAVATSSAIDARLLAIETLEDIPLNLRNTPIEDLLKCQNFYEVNDETASSANLIIGMCIDHRKQLHLPKNLAYVIRSPGANMQGCEFSIALGLSSQIEYMALLVHNKCLMSDPYPLQKKVNDALVQEQGWSPRMAATFFDNHAASGLVGDVINFGKDESTRLQSVFRGLKVVPLLYDVDSDRLFLINRANDFID
jgi:sulfate permease, SulP family